MSIIIRKSITEDLENLKKISRDTLSTTHRPFLGDDSVDGFIHSGRCDQYVVDNLANSWSMLLDDSILGFAVSKENLIDLMMIDHRLHRKGYGTELLQFMENLLFGTYTEIFLESFDDNVQANNFYIKNKWIEVERFFDSYTKHGKIRYSKTT